MGHYYSEMGDDPYGWEAQAKHNQKLVKQLNEKLKPLNITVEDLAKVFTTKSGL